MGLVAAGRDCVEKRVTADAKGGRKSGCGYNSSLTLVKICLVRAAKHEADEKTLRVHIRGQNQYINNNNNNNCI